MRACAALLLVVSGCGDPGVAGEPGQTLAGNADTGEAAVAVHSHCAWIGQDTYAAGVATYLAHADELGAIHPKWYELMDGGAIRAFPNAGDPVLVDAAAAHRTLLMPMIDVRKVATLRAMLGDPATRSGHVAALVSLVIEHGYDGLDIDYEHLWTAADRPGYEAFVTELAADLHAAGKQLSIAAPGMTGPAKQAAYDYAFLAATADTIHIMGYDFHTSGTHPGPVAPLGWVQTLVAYAASIAPDHFILALPNYGVTPTWYGDSVTSAHACAGAMRMTTDHMASCAYGHFEAGHAPNCENAAGETIYFDDLESLAAKVAAARAAGLAGISSWTLGGEPDGFFAMVRQSYPR